MAFSQHPVEYEEGEGDTSRGGRNLKNFSSSMRRCETFDVLRHPGEFPHSKHFFDGLQKHLFFHLHSLALSVSISLAYYSLAENWRAQRDEGEGMLNDSPGMAMTMN